MIPAASDWLSIVNGVLDELCYASAFEQIDGISAEDTAEAFSTMWSEYIETDWTMIGAIIPYVTADAPQNTLPCDGATHARTDFPALYAALDDAFLLDADTFRTPDLRGRTIIGTGTGSGLSARGMGDSDGSERITLGIDEVPNHSHSDGVAVPTAIPVGPGLPAPSAIPGLSVTGSTGGGSSHDNMMPFLALGYAIIAR